MNVTSRLRRIAMVVGGNSVKRALSDTAVVQLGKKAKIATETRHVQRIAFWNVNGLRAVVKKPNIIPDFIEKFQPDLLCMSETKCKKDENPLDLSDRGYRCHMNSATVKKGGYSGTAIYTRVKPESVSYGIGECDDEGRLMTMELPDYYVVVVYVPNSGAKLDRLKYRTTEWDVKFRQYVKDLQAKKPVIVTGDLNVAHLDIDVHDPIKNRNKTAGFCDEERENFTKLLEDCDLVDMYRKFHPFETVKAFTYYSYRFNCRAKQKGWRLDYVLASSRLADQIKGVQVVEDQIGSDHLPIIVDFHSDQKGEPRASKEPEPPATEPSSMEPKKDL